MINFSGKTFLITGVANKKSVATFVAKSLIENGATCLFSVQSANHAQKVETLFPDSKIFICDVEKEQDVWELANKLENTQLSGILHSIAFANYSEGIKPFHETNWTDFAQATNISCFSLVSLLKYLHPIMCENSSVVTVSISNLRATNYGYMGPVKAALESCAVFLAKSLSHKKIRCNAVGVGPLKTSASAGIPGYIENYLYTTQLCLNHEALKTQEVANTISFLLSPLSSGINAQTLIVDNGMSANYFDELVVSAFNSK
ncbi:MAG: SDR family oxidoreductase [Halobacteriovoraceae bacterium]|nr:SDR family oxidoreductase [Halobacteriovoraceae bacterium]